MAERTARDEPDDQGEGILVPPAEVVPGSLKSFDFGKPDPTDPGGAPFGGIQWFSPNPDAPQPAFQYQPHTPGSAAGNLMPAPVAPPEVSLGVTQTGPGPAAAGGPIDRGPGRDTALGTILAGAGPRALGATTRDVVQQLIEGLPGDLANLRRQTDERQRAYQARIDEAIRQDRAKGDIFRKMQEDLAEYRKGMREARPPLPELKDAPAVPDLKIRPWLDPEGKDALTVIGKTLGMLATGISGVVLNAPQTALRQFREAAEAWRRDEVDTANSRFQQFKATVSQIELNNTNALRRYELADQRYGANIQAKHAAVLADLEEFKLQDQLAISAQLPYQLAQEAIDKSIGDSKTILDATDKFLGVAKNYQDAKARKTYKTKGEALGASVELERQLNEATDPAEQTRLKADKAVADAYVRRLHDMEQQGARERYGIAGAARDMHDIN